MECNYSSMVYLELQVRAWTSSYNPGETMEFKYSSISRDQHWGWSLVKARVVTDRYFKILIWYVSNSRLMFCQVYQSHFVSVPHHFKSCQLLQTGASVPPAFKQICYFFSFTCHCIEESTTFLYDLCCFCNVFMIHCSANNWKKGNDHRERSQMKK